MDARDEGSEREPGSVAPEGGATGGVTGGTPLPGPRPAGESVTGERLADAPPSGAEAPSESGDGAPGTTGAEAVPGPEPEATGPDAGSAEDDAGAPEDDAGTSAESGSLGSEAAAPREFERGAGETVFPRESERTESEAAASEESEPGRSEAVLSRESERGALSGGASSGFAGAGSGASAFPGSPEAAGCPEAGAPVGLAALSLRHQIAAALALAVVAVVACTHLGMVFLHVAPSNTVTKQHGRAIDDWIYPEFEQNWKLFAPNPLQQDITVQVRALVRTEDGTSRETGWYDLSALDGLAIDGNPVPSHTQQNELRRAWDFYLGTHDGENRPVGLRGDLSERYLRRIGVLRLDRERAGGEGAVVERVQFRSLTTDVPPPRWSGEKVSDRPVVRELPWWAVPGSDRADGLTEASAR
ncbi:DUF5819 family protein [Streptomyces sp. NPDC002698]|uniref:DUF5819 family protein n=1 Tax=Streptomyces sp. NPDC002698 TaxID=3364660 RepID=UPI00369D2A82